MKQVVDGLLKRVVVHRRRMKFCHDLKKGDLVYLPRFARLCPVHKVDKVKESVTVEHGRMRIEVAFEDVMSSIGDNFVTDTGEDIVTETGEIMVANTWVLFY